MRLWRWLCCRTGHHRETVEIVDVWLPDWSTGLPNCFYRDYRLRHRCVDCGVWADYCVGQRATPSRRYALRGKA